MDVTRLHQILQETTIQLRKGEEVEGSPKLVEAVKNLREGDSLSKLPGGSVHIYAMPHESQAAANIEKVDCHFITIGVDKTRAEQYKSELVAILKTYPHPERLAEGPSYIELGGEIGDQGAAFQLFALGQVLGLWEIITPAKLGITGDLADQMAGAGFVMMGGFKAA